MTRAALLLGAALGCSAPSRVSSPDTSQKTSVAVASTARSAPEQPPPPTRTSISASELEARLREHFAKYKEGSSFEFLTEDWAPRVERYLRQRNISSADLVRMARSFYADKTAVALSPKPGSLRVNENASRTTATFVLTLKWSTMPPPEARSCTYLDDCMDPHQGSKIQHEASVEAKLTLDASQRFVAYEELAPVRKRLVIKTRGDGAIAFPSMPTQPARWVEPPTAAKVLRDGTLVEDLGDSFTCGVESSEVDTVRKVRVDGETVWLLERWIYNTGHNFVGEDVLVAVPETVNAPPSDRAAGKP